MKEYFKFPKSIVPYEEIESKGLYCWQKKIDSYIGNGKVIIDGLEKLMLGGYSYLGLIKNDAIKRKAIQAIDEYGIGAYGTRISVGTTNEHRQLEIEISEMVKAEDALLYPSGYNANLSTISALVGKNDAIISDELVHASIIDGCLLSGARIHRFNHNDIDDLEKKLKNTQNYNNRLVVVDAVYSMDGDVAKIPEISELCKQYQAVLMVDEAHSLGVIGQNGFGIQEYFNLDSDAIDIKMGTFSKAFPGTGGFVAGSHKLINYLKHNGRSYIFSGATCPSTIAAGRESLNVLKSNPHLVEELRQKDKYFKELCHERGLDIGLSETPISPILIPDDEKCLRVAKYCFEHGVYVPAVVFPVVPRGKARLRVTITVELSMEDIKYAADIFYQGVEKYEAYPSHKNK